MATNTEKVDDLIRLVARLDALIESVEKRVSRLEQKLDELAAACGRADSRTSILEREVAELKAHRDEWGRRAWSLVVPIITAIVGGVVGYLLKR